MPPKRKAPDTKDDREREKGKGKDKEKDKGKDRKKARSETPYGLQLPHTRVKRICKEEGDIRSMTTEATLVMTRAAELFLAKLASEAYKHTLKDKRKTLLYRDMASAVAEVEAFDFLADVIPPTKTKRELVLELMESGGT